jgi:hypothetical protein
MKKFYVATADQTMATVIKRLIMAEDAVDSLTQIFNDQLNEFIKKETLKIRFSGTNFKCDPDEIFFIEQYQLPAVYQKAIQDSSSIPLWTMSTTETHNIRSIFAIDTDEQRDEIISFQYFSASKVLERGKHVFIFKKNAFDQLNDPGFIIDSKLSAVYQEKTLYFRSYDIVKRFLYLLDYFRQATDDQIKDFLSDPLFTCNNVNQIIAESDDWMRRRFTSIRALKILDKMKNVKSVAKKAEKYGIDMVLEKNESRLTIVIPKEKKDIKQLLRFLNEEYYTGEITGKQYLTNSQTQIQDIAGQET